MMKMIGNEGADRQRTDGRVLGIRLFFRHLYRGSRGVHFMVGGYLLRDCILQWTNVHSVGVHMKGIRYNTTWA